MKSFIFAADINQQRLALAKELGATNCFTIQSNTRPQEVAAKIVELFGETAVTMDCVGIESSIQTAVHVNEIEKAIQNFLTGHPPARHSHACWFRRQ